MTPARPFTHTGMEPESSSSRKLSSWMRDSPSIVLGLRRGGRWLFFFLWQPTIKISLASRFSWGSWSQHEVPVNDSKTKKRLKKPELLRLTDDGPAAQAQAQVEEQQGAVRGRAARGARGHGARGRGARGARGRGAPAPRALGARGGGNQRRRPATIISDEEDDGAEEEEQPPCKRVKVCENCMWACLTCQYGLNADDMEFCDLCEYTRDGYGSSSEEDEM
eukprot:g79765.t1